MGAEESKDPNANITAGNRRGREKQKGTPKSQTPLSKVPGDAYFSHVDVEDHIRPIFGGVEKRDKKELDDDLENIVDLTKLLGDLGKKKEESDDDDLLDFPEFEESEEDDSDDDDDDDRGKFHHDVKDVGKTKLDIFAGESHPLRVKGDCCVFGKLVCKDASDWAVQYPLYRIQWFIGIEIGNQVTFQATPAGEGTSFLVPAESVGRYIEVVATRRVEDQLKTVYDDKAGAFDPHVQKARQVETQAAPKFIDVNSTSVIGPVQISDEWAFAIIRALSEAEFTCAVKLRDELNSDGDNHETHDAGSSAKQAAILMINKSAIQFTYTMKESHQRKSGNSSLFSIEWLSRIVGRKQEEAVEDDGDVTVKMKLKTVHFRPSEIKSSIVLATRAGKKGFSHSKVLQDLIRFDVDPEIGRDLLLFICISFQFAAKKKLDDPLAWKDAYDNGEVDQAKDLIQQYLEEVASTVEAAPAYEEVPVNPWDY